MRFLELLVVVVTCFAIACGDDGGSGDSAPGDSTTGDTAADAQPDGTGDTGPPGPCTREANGMGCEALVCEAPTPECVEDSDCVVAMNHGGSCFGAACCLGCEDAVPAALVDAERCLARRLRPVPERCGCDNVGCPPIDCIFAGRARCMGGQCRATDCEAGEVPGLGGGCAPSCTDDADCVLAGIATTCCPGCLRATHRDLVDAEPCIVGEAEAAPTECMPATCDDGCPDIACVAVAAVCGPMGMCLTEIL